MSHAGMTPEVAEEYKQKLADSVVLQSDIDEAMRWVVEPSNVQALALKIATIREAAFKDGAREGWMRAVVYYTDICADEDPAVQTEIDQRWPRV